MGSVYYVIAMTNRGNLKHSGHMTADEAGDQYMDVVGNLARGWRAVYLLPKDSYTQLMGAEWDRSSRTDKVTKIEGLAEIHWERI